MSIFTMTLNVKITADLLGGEHARLLMLALGAWIGRRAQAAVEREGSLFEVKVSGSVEEIKPSAPVEHVPVFRD